MSKTESGEIDRSNELWGGHPVIRAANEKALCVAKFPARVLLQGATGTGKSMLARHIHLNSGRTRYKTVCQSVWQGLKGRRLQEMLAWAAGTHDTDDKNADLNAFGKKLKSAIDGFELPSQTFREINLAALPELTISSELFGYVAGAFTDANKHGSPGLFINANAGTLFLDEIADCPLSIQAKLLSVIQQRQEADGDCACYVIPNGQEEEVRVNVRLICATNKDLRKEVDAGRFREDLYYRLKEYEIRLPSISELVPSGAPPFKVYDVDKGSRKLIEKETGNEKYYVSQYIEKVLEDINKKLKSKVDDYVPKSLEHDGCETTAKKRLLEYPFPGNYREIQSCLMQACLNARTRFIMESENGKGEDGTEIEKRDLPREIREYSVGRRGIVDKRLENITNDSLREKIKSLLQEMQEMGLCTGEDIAALCDMDGFKFPVQDKTEKGEKYESGAPSLLRDLCYFIYLVKSGKCKTKIEYAAMLRGVTDQALDDFFAKFGIVFSSAEATILEVYGLTRSKSRRRR